MQEFPGLGLLKALVGVIGNPLLQATVISTIQRYLKELLGDIDVTISVERIASDSPTLWVNIRLEGEKARLEELWQYKKLLETLNIPNVKFAVEFFARLQKIETRN